PLVLDGLGRVSRICIELARTELADAVLADLDPLLLDGLGPLGRDLAGALEISTVDEEVRKIEVALERGLVGLDLALERCVRRIERGRGGLGIVPEALIAEPEHVEERSRGRPAVARFVKIGEGLRVSCRKIGRDAALRGGPG